jgi:hypothetical protein
VVHPGNAGLYSFFNYLNGAPERIREGRALAQPRALGLKVSDEFTVPLCCGHHRQLHQAGDEPAWWDTLDINVLEIAKGLWAESHAKDATINQQSPTIIADFCKITTKS